MHKSDLRERFGSACSRCGYSKCQRALHFHHINGRNGQSGTTDPHEIDEFPERFELVCANCHIEIHEEIDVAKRVYRQCEQCGTTFRVKQSSASREGRGRFCSKACAHAHRRPVAMTDDRVLERIQRFISVADNGCHIWTGTCGGIKTPMIVVVGSNGKWTGTTVKKFLFRVKYPDRTPPKRIRSTCGNQLCVNSDHLPDPDIDLQYFT